MRRLQYQSIIYLPEKIAQAGHKGCKTTLISALKTSKINYIECSFWKADV